MHTEITIIGDINSTVNTLTIDGTAFDYSTLNAENQAKVDAMIALISPVLTEDGCCKLSINSIDIAVEIIFADLATLDDFYVSLMDYDYMSDEEKNTIDEFLNIS